MLSGEFAKATAARFNDTLARGASVVCRDPHAYVSRGAPSEDLTDLWNLLSDAAKCKFLRFVLCCLRKAAVEKPPAITQIDLMDDSVTKAFAACAVYYFS